MALKLETLVQRQRHPGRAIARRQNFLIHADGTRTNVTLLSASGPFLLTATAVKE
jgi:hypothetical protein